MTTSTPLRMEYTVHFATQAKGRKTLPYGEKPTPVGRVPRVARLLALAHHFDHLIAQGVVQDYAEIARLAQLSRARVAQIMALKFLAPDIQERIALLPQRHGKDVIRHGSSPSGSHRSVSAVLWVPDVTFPLAQSLAHVPAHECIMAVKLLL